jgi:hypothetical protein
MKIRFFCAKCRVADPGCLSRIPDPDFYPSRIPIFTHPGSRIPDPGSKTATKERGEKKFVVTNFTELIWIQELKRHQIPDPEHWQNDGGHSF